MGSNYIINITCQPPEGADPPWFQLSFDAKDTVQWINPTNAQCTLTFHGGSPFPRSVTIPPGASSPVFSAANAPGPPAGWPPNKIYKTYKYTVDCVDGCSFDPGGGILP